MSCFAVSTEELDDFAALLLQAGIVSVEANWRGFRCQFTEGREDEATEALGLLRKRLESLPTYGARKAFVDRLSEVATERAKAAPKDSPPVHH